MLESYRTWMKMNCRSTPRPTWILLLLFLCVPGPFFGQKRAPVEGSISALRGIVTDTRGKPVDGVEIKVVGIQTGLSRSVVTTGDGRYYVSSLPPGPYQVTASRSGYVPAQGSVTVPAHSLATLDLKLRSTESAQADQAAWAAPEGVKRPPSQDTVEGKADDDWSAWRLVIGQWQGEGGGRPGQAVGSFSFAFDLQGNILVRRSRAEYPPEAGRAAFVHEDLMIVYREPEPKRTRAAYFDNEGHTIHYTAEFSEDHMTLQFLSDPDPQSPRFRLTYKKVTDDSLAVTFEIAPAGRPDAFSKYLEGTARRQ